MQGIIPVTSYLRSAKGQVIPVGYTGMSLSDYYDQDSLLFNTGKITPSVLEFVIQKRQS